MNTKMKVILAAKWELLGAFTIIAVIIMAIVYPKHEDNQRADKAIAKLKTTLYHQFALDYAAAQVDFIKEGKPRIEKVDDTTWRFIRSPWNECDSNKAHEFCKYSEGNFVIH